MSDEPRVHDPEAAMKRVVALKQVRDRAEAELKAAQGRVKLARKEFKRADAVFQKAVDEEGDPSLFSPGVTVTSDDIGWAEEKVTEAPEE